MVRVSKNLQFVTAALLCTALVGCSSSGGADPDATAEDVLKVSFNPMYSAWDGVHEYKLPATLDAAAFNTAGTDPVKMETVSWKVDAKFVTKEPYADLPGGVLLTTKTFGMTTVTAYATTMSGKRVKGSAQLTITKATPEEWELGEARYNNMIMIDFTKLMPPAGGGMGMGMVNIMDLIPRNSSCANCHNNTNGLTVEHTPQQTGGYSDDELINIFTMGAKPMGIGFNSPFLKMVPAQFATTIYTMLHTWDIPEETRRGIVFKLRSITPKTQAEIDINRLRMMMMPAAAAGAAGAGM